MECVSNLKGIGIRDSTSYPNKAAAEKVIGKITDHFVQDIADWANNAADNSFTSFKLDFDEQVGYGISSGDTELSPRNSARVVLKIVPDKGIKILTSYPINLKDTEKSNELNKKYRYGLTNLLCHFLEDTYLPEDDWDDYKTIVRYTRIFDQYTLRLTIDQGKELLNQKPIKVIISSKKEMFIPGNFPSQWIEEMTNRSPFDKGYEATPQDYYDWVKWMIDTLEVEAKKAGKL